MQSIPYGIAILEDVDTAPTLTFYNDAILKYFGCCEDMMKADFAQAVENTFSPSDGKQVRWSRVLGRFFLVELSSITKQTNNLLLLPVVDDGNSIPKNLVHFVQIMQAVGGTKQVTIRNVQVSCGPANKAYDMKIIPIPGSQGDGSARLIVMKATSEPDQESQVALQR